MGKKLDYQHIKDFINSDEGNGCRIVTTEEEFEKEKLAQNKCSTETKVKIMCTCGVIFISNYEDFKKKKLKSCNICRNNYRNSQQRKNIEQYKKEVYNLVENEYSVLGEYKGAKVKIKMRHNCTNCNNHKYDVTPDGFLNKNSRCPKCMRPNHDRDTEKFKKEVFNLVGDEYSVFGEYKNNSTKMKFVHHDNKCNSYEFGMRPADFLKGQRCPKCAGNAKKNHEDFLKEVYNITKNEYSVLSKYMGDNKYVLIRHNNSECDNHEWMIKPSNFLQGKRCPKCRAIKVANIRRLDGQIVIDAFKNSGLEPQFKPEQYKNNSQKLPYICPEHRKYGVQFIQYGNLQQGQGCALCNDSKGEKKIAALLSIFELPFISEYSFNDLIGNNGGLLRFDFAIFNDVNKTDLQLLIEFDGIQHIKWMKGWQSKKDYNNLVEHDKRKNVYCEKNNIKLLRIPYSEFDNIEKIIIEKLNISN